MIAPSPRTAPLILATAWCAGSVRRGAGASLVGDVLLMLPREQFCRRLLRPFPAHFLCYIAGFVARGLRGLSVAIALVGTVMVLGEIAIRVLRGVARNEPALRAPVIAYLVVIGTMLAVAVASGNPIAGVAAAVFVGSDAMIAWSKFVAASRSRWSA